MFQMNTMFTFKWRINVILGLFLNGKISSKVKRLICFVGHLKRCILLSYSKFVSSQQENLTKATSLGWANSHLNFQGACINSHNLASYSVILFWQVVLRIPLFHWEMHVLLKCTISLAFSFPCSSHSSRDGCPMCYKGGTEYFLWQSFGYGCRVKVGPLMCVIFKYKRSTVVWGNVKFCRWKAIWIALLIMWSTYLTC